MHQGPLYVFLTGRVGLLLVHGQKLVPLVLGPDPLFPQEPARGTFGVYLLHACFNHWDAHTNLTWLIRPFITRVFLCVRADVHCATWPSQKTKCGARDPKGKCPCARVPIPSGTQLTFHQDFVSCRPNGRSPEKPEPLHTRWLCCLLCARRHPCGSSLNLTAACFIITEKLSRRPQTELLLPVLKPQEVAILIRGTVWAFFVVVFFA